MINIVHKADLEPKVCGIDLSGESNCCIDINPSETCSSTEDWQTYL